MPSFSADIPHSLGQAPAQARMEHFLDQIREKYQDQVGDLEQEWEGNVLRYRFTTFAIKVSGAVTVAEDSVHVTVDLPFSALIFKSKIVGGIKQAIEKELIA